MKSVAGQNGRGGRGEVGPWRLERLRPIAATTDAFSRHDANAGGSVLVKDQRIWRITAFDRTILQK